MASGRLSVVVIPCMELSSGAWTLGSDRDNNHMFTNRARKGRAAAAGLPVLGQRRYH